ncbi:DUF3829 domain-containing protein [Achromobacter seleniivolatilans]|uniref:DUF3829 domain-containing protein n=1 Tax=Achromobacter seleniivolatilans TaxID=3047478 RepID=A0ABY9M0D7_9BURK|nr:DUF3829 domain-containing protein [Achromobacter sp. R39]WMD20452.1 DUF3829 domain-containing protein [Achromobacter sp. R39]
MSIPRILGASILIASALMLGACKEEPASAPPAKAEQSAAAQAEFIKFNLYLATARGIIPQFKTVLERYQTYVVPNLKGDRPLRSLSINSNQEIARTREALENAMQVDAVLPQVDASAQAFADALAALAPLNQELEAYAKSKAYVSDGGALVRQKNDAYEAALTLVVQQEAAFLNGVAKRDRFNTQAAFDNAEKDSTAYYRAGLVYYGKISIDEAQGVFDGTGLGARADAFAQAQEKMNEMARGYDKSTRRANPKGCPSVMNVINAYLNAGRTIEESSRSGRYGPAAVLSGGINPMLRDASQFRQSFNNLTNALDATQGRSAYDNQALRHC